MAEHPPISTSLTKRVDQKPRAELRPIRTSWQQRTHQFRCGFIPLAAFLGCGLMAGWLWERQYLRQDAVGEVFAPLAELTSPADGLLLGESLYAHELLESVRAGQVVARLDDRPVLAALATLQADLARLRAELEAADQQVRQDQEDREHDRQVEARRLIVQVEALRLNILDRKARIAEDQVERQRFDELSQRLNRLIDRNAASIFEVIDAQLRRDAADVRIKGGRESLAEAEAQLATALERVETDASLRMAEREGHAPESYLAPTRAAITAQEARIRELELQIEGLEIRSPIDGQVVAVARWPGQSVRAGDPILTVASTESRYIVSYLRQEQRIHPSEGAVVEVRPRTAPVRSYRTGVEQVGPQVLPVPEHQLRDPRVLEWGLPVRIELPPDSDLRPGELVDLSFQLRKSPADRWP